MAIGQQKKSHVKRANGLRRSTVEIRASIHRFIAVSGSLRRRSDSQNYRPGISRNVETFNINVSRRPSTELVLANMIDLIMDSETQLFHQDQSDLAFQIITIPE